MDFPYYRRSYRSIKCKPLPKADLINEAFEQDPEKGTSFNNGRVSRRMAIEKLGARQLLLQCSFIRTGERTKASVHEFVTFL